MTAPARLATGLGHHRSSRRGAPVPRNAAPPRGWRPSHWERQTAGPADVVEPIREERTNMRRLGMAPEETKTVSVLVRRILSKNNDVSCYCWMIF